jgi:hypothetical protein
MPVNRRLVYGGIAVGGAGVAYYLWKKNKAAKTQASQASAYGYGYGYGYGTPANPPYGYGGYGGYAGGYAPGYGYGYNIGGSTGGRTPAGYGYGYGYGTGAGTGTGVGSGGGTPVSYGYGYGYGVLPEPRPPTGGGRNAGGITNLRVTGTTKSSFTVRWNPAVGATGGYAYIVRDLNTHQQVDSNTTMGTSATISGLRSGIVYNFGIQGLPGGPGSNIHVKTK